MAYDVMAALQTLMQGLVVQETMLDAGTARYLVKGAPLDSGDIAGILSAANVENAADVAADYLPTTQANYPTTLPAYPTGLPRFARSNPASDGWSIGQSGKVVFGE